MRRRFFATMKIAFLSLAGTLRHRVREVATLGVAVTAMAWGGWLVARDFPAAYPVPTAVAVSQHSACGGRLLVAATIDKDEALYLAVLLGRQPQAALYDRGTALPRSLSTLAAVELARQKPLTSPFSKLPATDAASGRCDQLHLSVGVDDAMEVEPLAAYVERDRHICAKDNADCLKTGVPRDDLAVVANRGFWLTWELVRDSFSVNSSAVSTFQELSGEGLTAGAKHTQRLTAKRQLDEEFRYYGLIFKVAGPALNLGLGTNAVRLKVYKTSSPPLGPEMIQVQSHASPQFAPNLAGLFNAPSAVGRDFFVNGTPLLFTEELRWQDVTFDRRRAISDMIGAMLLGFGFTLIAEFFISRLARSDR